MSGVAHFLAPVEGPSPAGREARLDPEHELLRTEITKLSDVRGQPVDWPMVQSLGSDILLARSKDLLIAAYVACALTAQRGLAGAADGTELVAGLLTQFGATLFPTRQRARGNALNWYLEWMTAYLDNARTDSAAEVHAVRTQLRALSDVSTSVLGPDAPIFEGVLRSCERLERSVAVKVPDPPPLAPASAPSAEPTAAVAQAPDGAELQAWLAPLAEAPGGIDSSYDEQHVAVRVEIEKLQGLGNETPNWRAVYDGSASLLRTVSKDLTLASYLAAALLELRGLAGLSEGLRLCSGLLERYWDTMWPPVARVKRRANALDWLFERAAQRLGTPSASDKATLEAALAELKAGVDARFAGGLASLGALSEALAKLAPGEPAQPAEMVSPPPTVEAPVVPAPPPIAAAAAPAISSAERAAAEYVFQAPPSTPAELANYTQRAGSLVVDMARARFEADRKDARAYRWLRLGAWLRWDRAPGANRRGRIDLDGPSPARRSELTKALQAEQWDEALALGELLVSRYPLWLDANRASAQALDKLGAEYAPARAHVEAESRAFFARLPQLAELQFADGSALASPETIAWLRPPRGAGEGAAAVELPEGLVERLQKADRAALVEFEELVRACRSQRASFLLRLELARALERGEQPLKAANVYLGLERDLDAYGLEQWEPELALQVLQPLWSLLSRGSPLGVVQSEAARVCARLARLLPTALL